MGIGYTERLGEQLAIVATIDPQSTVSTTGGTASTTSLTTDVVDMDDFRRIAFIMMVNTIAASSGVTLYVQEGTGTTAGTFNTATAVASCSTLVNADDDSQVLVEVKAEDLSAGYRYVRGVVVVGPTTATAGTVNGLAVVALADTARYKPASDLDLASVDQIVSA